MRRSMLTAFAIGGLAFGPELAMASPLAPPVAPTDPAVTQIDEGCGAPWLFRAPNGVCYRKPGWRRPYYGGCAYGFHPTPYGCRPNY